MRFAVLIKTQYARHLPPRWVTHTVETDANVAYQAVEELRANNQIARVVEYHSRDWEILVDHNCGCTEVWS